MIPIDPSHPLLADWDQSSLPAGVNRFRGRD
jgi:hypothetical protein